MRPEANEQCTIVCFAPSLEGPISEDCIILWGESPGLTLVHTVPYLTTHEYVLFQPVVFAYLVLGTQTNSTRCTSTSRRLLWGKKLVKRRFSPRIHNLNVKSHC